MTILITADIHLSNNPRDAYRHNFMKKLPAVAKRLKADLVLILGDFTEEKDRHQSELVNAVVDHIDALAQICPVVCLKGNHDWLSNADSPYFGFLARLEHVSWVSHPTPLANLNNVPVTALEALGRGAILLPHTANPDRDWTDLNLAKYNWAFTHQCYAGASSDSGFQLSGQSLSIFPKGLKVISGDIHTPQQVGPVTYVGSPYLVDFVESSIEPRMLLIDDKGGLESIPCEGPQKRLVEVKSIDGLKLVKCNVGDILKVRVEISPEQHPEWNEIANAVREWGAKNKVEVHAVQPIIKLDNKRMTKARKDAPKRSDAELLVEYAQHRSVDAQTLKAGEQLL